MPSRSTTSRALPHSTAPFPMPLFLRPHPIPTARPASARLVVGGADGLKRLLQADRLLEHLPAGEGVSDVDGIAPAHLPAVDSDLFREQIHATFHREVRLVGSEAAHGAARRVVRAGRYRVYRDVLDLVGAAGVPSRALEHLRAHGGVGAGVAEHVRLDRGQVTLGVAADFVAHADWMALRMNPNRFLAVEREPHRAARHLGKKTRVRLDRHVLLAAERTAVRDELDLEICYGYAEKRRHLALVVEDSLALGVGDGSSRVAGRVRRGRSRVRGRGARRAE